MSTIPPQPSGHSLSSHPSSPQQQPPAPMPVRVNLQDFDTLHKNTPEVGHLSYSHAHQGYIGALRTSANRSTLVPLSVFQPVTLNLDWDPLNNTYVPTPITSLSPAHVPSQGTNAYAPSPTIQTQVSSQETNAESLSSVLVPTVASADMRDGVAKLKLMWSEKLINYIKVYDSPLATPDRRV